MLAGPAAQLLMGSLRLYSEKQLPLRYRVDTPQSMSAWTLLFQMMGGEILAVCCYLWPSCANMPVATSAGSFWHLRSFF